MFKTGRMIGYGNGLGRTLARGVRPSLYHEENYDEDAHGPNLQIMYHSLSTFEKCLLFILIIAYVIMPIIYVFNDQSKP